MTTQNYEHHSHTHCWNNEQRNLGNVPPCGIKIENHTQCCLCDITPESPCCSAGIVDGRCGDCKELVD